MIQGIRSDRQSAWWTMDGGLWHCTGGSDQDHPQENEMQKGKMVVWGGLTNSWEKKRRQRRKGNVYLFECKVPKHIWRDKKAFLSDRCKKIEESNRIGKTRDLFKKLRDTKEAFHAKMGTVKDRKCMDLTEAEDIKKRCQEYTEELYKKDLHNLDNHNGDSPRARHPGMWSQVGLGKHHYEQR